MKQVRDRYVDRVTGGNDVTPKIRSDDHREVVSGPELEGFGCVVYRTSNIPGPRHGEMTRSGRDN